MSNTTHGATRAKLIENGYAPVATDRTVGWISADLSGAILTVPGYQSECGLTDYAQRRVIAIAVIARDTKVRADIMKVLAAHGIGKGPVRVASDGVESFVIRWDSREVPYSMMTDPVVGEHDPALAVISQAIDSVRGDMRPALIRLDGTWKNGDLLTTPRSKLPALDTAKFAALFAEIKSVLRQHSPTASQYVLPPVNPRAKAERERIEAELSKRTNAEIWQEVESRLRSASSFGISEWERAASRERAESPQARIDAYDEILAERTSAEAKARRRA